MIVEVTEGVFEQEAIKTRMRPSFIVSHTITNILNNKVDCAIDGNNLLFSYFGDKN